MLGFCGDGAGGDGHVGGVCVCVYVIRIQMPLNSKCVCPESYRIINFRYEFTVAEKIFIRKYFLNDSLLLYLY